MQHALTHHLSVAPLEPAGATLSFADIEMNDDSHEVTKAGKSVSLSPTEYNLLRYLLQKAGRVMSKAQMSGRATSVATPMWSSRTSRTCAARSTRRRLEPAGSPPAVGRRRPVPGAVLR
jgi:DNA-binding response OmpR family regulator